MENGVKINQSTLRLLKGDLTDLEVDAFVYYSRSDLQLGSGFGTAIAIRGGPSIAEELKEIGLLDVGQAVVTGAGEMKADKIIHAVGPRFREPDINEKLKTTVENALKCAEKENLKRIAFPPMGTGLYGIPLDTCASIMIDVISEYLLNHTAIEEVIICLIDKREYEPFLAQLKSHKKVNYQDFLR